MQNFNQVDNLKFRVSYGITGSQGIGALATRSQPRIDANLNYPFSGGTYQQKRGRSHTHKYRTVCPH